MTKWSPDNYKSIDLKVLCEELAELEWLNRAMRRQININENRIAQIDKILAQNIEDKNNDQG